MLEASIGMGMRALLNLKGFYPMHRIFHSSMEVSRWSRSLTVRNCSAGKASSLQPPDLPRLAQTARISLTPDEVEEFAPKIGQVIDWFGQLQAVDLDNVDPSIRADTEGDNLREDVPETFENREAIVASIPVYEDQYLKVPKVLNKE